MYTLTYDVTGDLPEGYTAPAKQTLVKGQQLYRCRGSGQRVRLEGRRERYLLFQRLEKG